MPTLPANLAPQPTKGLGGRLWGRLQGFVEGDYVDQVACNAGFARMHRRDAIGDKLHFFFAVGGLLCLLGPVTMTEIALLPLVAFFLVRVVNTFPIWIHGFGQPVVLAGLLLTAWMIIALVWSPDPVQGWREIGELRWIAIAGFLYPVIEHRKTLIAALCVGFLLGQTGQVLDAFDGFGVEPLAELVENHPGRIAGWWHPVVGGGMLLAAMGLHLPAAFLGTGRTRVFGVLGLGLSAIGVLATGTRGAWIGGLLLLVIGLLLAMRIRRVPLRRVLLILVIGAGLVGVAGVVMRDSIMIRVNETREELREIRSGDYASYSGRRVQMASDAIDAFVAHPIAGVGSGGYRQWRADRNEDGEAFGDHAHNSALHSAATLGVVGLLLWGLIVVVAFRNAWRWGVGDPGSPYAMGPMLGIVGLMLASITDSVHINAQSAALLGVLLALCPAYAPNGPGIEAEARSDENEAPAG